MGIQDLMTADEWRSAKVGTVGKARGVHKPLVMNKTERAYAAMLDVDPSVAAWYFEAITLRLAKDRRYTPDFHVIRQEAGVFTVEFHECKGFEMEDAMVKLGIAASLYPWYTFRLAKLNKGVWTVTTAEPQPITQRILP